MQPSVPDSFDLDMGCGDWNSNDYEPSQQEGPALEATEYNLRPHRALSVAPPETDWPKKPGAASEATAYGPVTDWGLRRNPRRLILHRKVN